MNLIIKFITLLLFISANLGLVANADTTQTPQTNKHHVQGEYVRHRFLPLMKKPFELSDVAKTKILIIGDSHAQDFLNSIAENKLLEDGQIRTRYIPTRCQIYLGAVSNKKWMKEDIKLCKKSDNLTLAKAQIANADVIIFAALWRKWAVRQLPQTIKNLKLSADQTLFVIGRRSFLNVKNERVDGLSKKQLRAVRKEVDIHQIDINALMSNTLDEGVFINVHKLVCGTGSNCPAFTDRFKMISLDGGHLSKDGARYLGKILFDKSPLSKLTK